MTKTKIILSGFMLLILLSPFAVSWEQKSYKSYTDIGPIEKSDTTIAMIFADKDKYHREVFTVEGLVTDIEYKKIITGRKFTLFKLSDTKNNSINVYARGFVGDLKEGSAVRIYGRYSKKKSFMFKKYKNVMKARKIYIMDKQTLPADVVKDSTVYKSDEKL